MKIFKTEIWIDKENRWWNGDQEIINKGVLTLFKMNLHFDNDYFIHLKYKDKEEKGYLKLVEGFPLIANELEDNNQSLILKIDNNQSTILNQIFYDEDKNTFWSLYFDSDYNNYLPYILSSKIIQIFQPYIIENNSYVFFIKENIKLPIIFKKFKPYNFHNKEK